MRTLWALLRRNGNGGGTTYLYAHSFWASGSKNPGWRVPSAGGVSHVEGGRFEARKKKEENHG